MGVECDPETGAAKLKPVLPDHELEHWPGHPQAAEVGRATGQPKILAVEWSERSL